MRPEAGVSRPRLAAFFADGRARCGVARKTGFTDCSARFSWPDLGAVIRDGALMRLAETAPDAVDFSYDEASFAPPLPAPEKILCVGVNYPARNEEYRDGTAAPAYMSLFVRFARSFVGHEAPLIRPLVSKMLDYEGEFAIVIGRGGRRIPRAEALSHIAAVTLCNEGTVRDWVRHGKFNVTQGKNFDASGSMGPWLVPFEDPAQIEDARLVTRVNGETRQDDRTSRMLFSVARQIEYISAFTTLVPGDVIVTGTPAGAGARLDPPVFLEPGDVIEVEGEGVGILRNGVADEA
jgi:2-keto-4-pentenoate hydratase/2-oxohepta-3-ene-1,7-dioic acid hydratase in catechol pathway